MHRILFHACLLPLTLPSFCSPQTYYGDDLDLRADWVRQIAHIISSCIAVCVYDHQGVPVSWQVLRLDGDSGFAHTMEEYRKSGLYSFVGGLLLLQTAQAGYDSFGYATETNKTQQYITMEKFGFENVASVGHRFYCPRKSMI